MSMTNSTPSPQTSGAEPDGFTTLDLLRSLRDRWKLLLGAPLAAGLVAFGVATVIAPTYTAVTTFMPPQQGQSMASSALAALGPLAGLAGGAGGIKSTGDQYAAFMQSVTVSDRIIDQFKLVEAYEEKYRVDARRTLANHVRINVGKKDGLISVEVDDKNAQRAADMANRYVEELRRITGTLAITEAQQRRVFFEGQLKATKEQLVKAQQTLQASGYTSNALKVEPKAAAESYAKLKAEVTAAQVRLQVLRGSMTDQSPEVHQQQATVAALNAEMARSEQTVSPQGGADYISKYRDFKYQEALFEMYARQFELARADESREGALIQVVDPATLPEKPSKPKRGFVTLTALIATFIFLTAWLLVSFTIRSSRPIAA